MQHLCKKYKLGRNSKHREALLRNLCISLITHKRIKTSLAKAKALRPFAERLITKAIRANLNEEERLHLTRIIRERLNNRDAVDQLINKWGPQFQDSYGGYLRIIKIGPRLSDSSKMALIEWAISEQKPLPRNLRPEAYPSPISEPAEVRRMTGTQIKSGNSTSRKEKVKASGAWPSGVRARSEQIAPMELPDFKLMIEKQGDRIGRLLIDFDSRTPESWSQWPPSAFPVQCYIEFLAPSLRVNFARSTGEPQPVILPSGRVRVSLSRESLEKEYRVEIMITLDSNRGQFRTPVIFLYSDGSVAKQWMADFTALS